ncbi:MAG TPA: cupredoxin domain-containing protein [Kofleriaceae bacterium]
MLRALLLSLCVVLSFACDKGKKQEAPPKQEAPVTAGTVAADGVRRIDIEANTKGYNPERIAGKPGEKLMLVFKRTVDAECLSQLKTPEGKVVDLPMNKPVEVAVTVPQSGELTFACGMDMFHGTIVAQPNG